MKWIWTLMDSHCTGCGICADICAFRALEMPPGSALPHPVPEACTGCMDCLKECPFGAIEVSERVA